jgi:hypothetical protein
MRYIVITMKRTRVYKGKKYTCDPFYSRSEKIWICTLRDVVTDDEVAKESGYGMTMRDSIVDAFYKLENMPAH